MPAPAPRQGEAGCFVNRLRSADRLRHCACRAVSDRGAPCGTLSKQWYESSNYVNKLSNVKEGNMIDIRGELC